jgi:hypothetical protein
MFGGRGRALAVVAVAAVGVSTAAVVVAAPASAATNFGTTITAGTTLHNGDWLRSTSTVYNKFAYSYYTLKFSIDSNNDGNLNEYYHYVDPSGDSVGLVWTATHRNLGSGYADLNSNGVLEVVGSKDSWKSGTGSLGVTKLVLGAAGHAKLETGGGAVKWDSWDGMCGQAEIHLGSISSAVSAGCRNRTGVTSDYSSHPSLVYSWGAGHGSAPGASYGICCSPSGYNDTTRFGFDCSGFTRYMYYRAWGKQDMAVGGGSAASQWSNGLGGNRIYDRSSLQIGDVMYFGSPVDHTGVYIGNGYILDALNHQYGIDVHSLSNGQYPAFTGALRGIFD